MLTDLKLHLYRKLYLCKDSDEAQLCALALLPYQVDFVKASVGRVKELVRLVIHWFKTSFANPTEENKYVTSTRAPCEPLSFRSISFTLSGPASFLGRQRGCVAKERERERRQRVQGLLQDMEILYSVTPKYSIMVW